MEPTRTPGRLGNSVPKAGLCALELGGDERGRGGSSRQQTNWAKNPWAAPEGGRQREQRAVVLPSSLPPWRTGIGGWCGVSGLGAAGKSRGSSDPSPGWWYRSKLAGDDKVQFSQKPKGWRSDSKKDCQNSQELERDSVGYSFQNVGNPV